MAAAHRMTELGWIGDITAFSITVNIWTDWTAWPWMLAAPRLEVMVHSIHYHDVARWFLGEPSTVFSVGGRTPGQAPVGETRSVTTCTYPSGAISVIHANHENGAGDNLAAFRIDGSRGAIRGTLGLLYDYPERPARHAGALELGPARRTAGSRTRWARAGCRTRSSGRWPRCCAPSRPARVPRSSGRDNIGTLRQIERIYASMETGRRGAGGRADPGDSGGAPVSRRVRPRASRPRRDGRARGRRRPPGWWR